ncbi:MAG: hypothetical protein AB7L66_01105 [Gemmatimonadales bacterium]
MASVTIDVGDTVEVSFRLKFKKAEVQRRPDRDSFQKIAVEATSDSKAIFAFDRDVTADDQTISGEIPFIASQFQPGFFKPGETWTVTAAYTGADQVSAPERQFVIGTVVIRQKAGA